MIVGGTASKAVLAVSLLAGVTYLFGMSAPYSVTTMMAWKGLGVWLLAVYAALNVKSNDGWLIVAVMAFGALGDVLVERSVEQGAGAFLVGHAIAAFLYWRNRRESLSPSQKQLAVVLVPAILLITWLLTADPLATFYSLFLAIMASSAWVSRFPRYRTGIGAMMFVASDLLIFARFGPLDGIMLVSWTIWGLYFFGQILIVLGVVETLSKDDPNEAGAGQGQL